MRDKIKELEAGLTHNQEEVSSLNEKAVKRSEEHAKDVATLTERIAQPEQQLKQEVENNIKLEQYTRRENLPRFNNIEETEGEDCKALVISIIQNVRSRCISYPIPCSTSGWEEAGR